MAFDPQREDYQRLALRFAYSLDDTDTAHETSAFMAFGRRFAQDRDSLPQSDSDRAFHLVTLASKAIDYELPFAPEDQAQKIIKDGHRILDEALSLDPHCYDALRMKAAAANPSFDSFLTFLNESASEVRAYCTEQANNISPDVSDERRRLLSDLAMRPYVRWVANQAEEALICGRNRETLRLAEHALELDPSDMADIRFTAALAYAKLEDEAGLDRFVKSRHGSGQTRPFDDAWTYIAYLALAFKQHDMQRAFGHIKDLVARYPHAAEALIRQNEFPDGVFARLAVMPYSEDEIILALSESTVLLQEGVDLEGRGVLSSWIIQETARAWPQAMLAVIAQQTAVDQADQPGPHIQGGHQ